MASAVKDPQAPRAVSLDDRWTVDSGRILLNGTQAIARVLLAQHAIDASNGLNTAGYISGYRGSPLGNVDTTLWSVAKRLEAANVVFQPGLNEDIAATAVRGTQQIAAVPGQKYDGVFAAWYGKGPGVDRSGDALKHGNFGGAHRHGGVAIFYGDDHAGKSSTIAHHSEQAMAAAFIPSLYPANAAEILDYGLLAFALSRYSGSWVGIKCVTEVVEQTVSADIDLPGFAPVAPPYPTLPPEGVHVQSGAFNPLGEELIVVDHRLPLVQRFVRANRIDRTIFRAQSPRLGIVTAGKSHGDTRQALELLGLDETSAARLGLSLYKVGCIWPLEPEGIAEFAMGHDTILVVEEKTSFVEAQIASILVNRPERPRLIGKRDEDGAILMSSAMPLEPIGIALAIAARLDRLGIDDHGVRTARDALAPRSVTSTGNAALPRRAPYFCSGCPHSRSTRIPAGSISMTGIGCHTMATFVRPKEALLPTHMGGEGTNWIGMAPFSETSHIFQNMGDGTYYHSGLLAIRAAIASGVNITYKILYNDAVAMTGGQPVDGPISVAEIAQQVAHEGVRTIILVSDNPDAHRGNAELPAGIRIEHRDNLDNVQRELREIPGCTVLIYEQTCAAEKRRRRKRGLYPDPPKRLFISKAVCEGCGDCSVQSTCVSLAPVETEFGTKRRIDQSSCNKDYSCLNGFCPSFITVHGAEPRKRERLDFDTTLLDGLPDAPIAPIARGTYNIMVAGIGGTGVITVAAIIGMAAHLEGRAASMFDMTGLAQKNGAVFSHIRLADTPERIASQKIGRRETDALLAFDLVAALADEAASTLEPGRSRALVNGDVTSTVAFQFDRNATVDGGALTQRLTALIGEQAIQRIDATALATGILGDSIAANLFMVGVAAQRGLLPVGTAAIEQAVTLNNTAIAFNLMAFRLGRLYAEQPDRVTAMRRGEAAPQPDHSLDAVIAARSAHLTDYQGEAYARRYRDLVERVRQAEQATLPESDAMTMAVARNYARLLAYKDEYEVARLLTHPSLQAELEQTFADGAKLSFNLAPPMLPGRTPDGRPRKREFGAAKLRPFLKLLASAKGLRGTAFDPFGRTAERRMERRLIADYEALVETALRRLTPENHGSATQLLGLADMIRGFGPVKEAAVESYQAKLAEHEAAA
ncbi:indolepyruvate ferredoxin oxidoreductase family protein [Sphingomonas colocasiae]|uniref:Indolepyruvate ferredoxin oxidoreductase family protein n=1 Tax=Sphingomonas colocasiae TaxID=1848973 RepID=A0ABS7PY17_9SPHN|nr:indolepyruvate ferredoxin oxidoreductase family protein [Sphingomonas colocasiae]MBY8826198.1 indolepyruvate ferredoxin oxidoreductase family protein [Sphingomonas colocasiae]